MNLQDSSTTSGFEDFGDGAVWATEADFQWAGDLPGGMNLGGTYAFNADFAKLGGKLEFTPGTGPTLQKESNTWCAYWSMWQYLSATGERPATIDTHDGRPDMEGIGLFSRFGLADQNTNPIAWNASIGLGGRGVFGARNDDTYGVGYFYNDLQQPRSILINLLESHTLGVEAYYDIALARSVSLTLDAQWASGAFTNVPDAFILGFRLDARL
jgi:porin